MPLVRSLKNLSLLICPSLVNTNSDLPMKLLHVTRQAITAHQGLKNLENTIDGFIESGHQADAMELLPIFHACTEGYMKTWDTLIDRPL